jgi:hypothetical protein
MHSTARTPRLLALLAAATLLVGSHATVVGAEPVGGGWEEDQIERGPAGPVGAEEPAIDTKPFPDVPGVDLEALGYEGAPINGLIVERLAEPLPSDPSERVAELIWRMELAPSELESLTGAEAVLMRVVDSLDRDLERARAGVQAHTRRAELAALRLAEARQRQAARSDSLSRHRKDMAEVAVAAYMRPPGSDSLSSVMGGAATTTDDLAAGVLFEVKTDHDGEVRDSMEVSLALAGERVGRADRDAVDTADLVQRAAKLAADIEARFTTVRAAHEKVAAARTLFAEQIPTLRPDLDKTIEDAWGSFEVPEGDGIGVPVVDVDGIRVHVSIAVRVRALLAVAHADGVPLGGWGHRSRDQQIALRKAHCGPTPEDVYLKPAGACSPPTARPGASMHERGLAIDFHLAGKSISTRESPGYQWLAANSARFGLHNLPSEPWHWSVNGQ